MGKLIDGVWVDQWYETKSGAFQREDSVFNHWVEKNSDESTPDKFQAESGRYHLYVSLACPWAHRTLIFRTLKKLTDHISLSIVSPEMLEHGWTFDKNTASTGDNLYNCRYLHELYTMNEPHYTGRVTVPLFTTLIRFDEVYHGHFKCNKQRIEDYPHLSIYRRRLYQWPGVADTTDFKHIKRHYYFSHTKINPTQIIPLGPEIDYWGKV